MSAMHASHTTITGSSDRPATQQKASHALRIAAIFTMTVTGPYAVLFLVALFLSVALTGNAFTPLIKRSMYGRANFDLLRKRVLCAA